VFNYKVKDIMLEKQTTIDRIEVLQDQTVAVRYILTITEDGNVLAQEIKGNYIKPGDDYSAEDAKVQAICATVHTPEIIAAYQATQIPA
jgi:hypothetical protein